MTTFNSPQPDRDRNHAGGSSEREEIRQRFKRALEAGERPQVSEFVKTIEQHERSALIRELLEIEADFHRLQMETLDIVPPLGEHAKDASTRGVEATLNQSSDVEAVDRNEEPPPPYVGRYEVGRPIGRGGFGSVYLGWDPQLEREVAIKIPRFRETDPDRRQKRIDAFLAEARAAVQLERHAGIVPVYDAGIEDGVCYIVSQFVPGGSLSDSGGQLKMSLAEKIRFTATLADTIAFAHEHGWVHRDIKPSNILIDDEGRPYLTDFGLTLKAADLAAAGGAMEGTPKYMSPEQAQAAHAAMRGQSCDITVDHRSDIYSLGVVFYELLTDRLPHCGDTVSELFENLIHAPATPPRKLSATIPASVSRISMRALEKNPERRFQSALELRDQLHAQANAIESTLTTSTIEPHSNSQFLSVALIGGALAAIVFGFVVWMLVQSRENYIAPNDSTSNSQVVLLDADSQSDSETKQDEIPDLGAVETPAELELNKEAGNDHPPIAFNEPADKTPYSPRTGPFGNQFQSPNAMPSRPALGRSGNNNPFTPPTMKGGPTKSNPLHLDSIAPDVEAKRIASTKAELESVLKNPQSTLAEIQLAVTHLREIADKDDAKSLRLIERAQRRLEMEEPPEVE